MCVVLVVVADNLHNHVFTKYVTLQRSTQPNSQPERRVVVVVVVVVVVMGVVGLARLVWSDCVCGVAVTVALLRLAVGVVVVVVGVVVVTEDLHNHVFTNM